MTLVSLLKFLLPLHLAPPQFLCVHMHLAYAHLVYTHLLWAHSHLCCGFPPPTVYWWPHNQLLQSLTLSCTSLLANMVSLYLIPLLGHHQFNLPESQICFFYSPSLNPLMILDVERTTCYWKFLLVTTTTFEQDRLSHVGGNLEVRANMVWFPFPAFILYSMKSHNLLSVALVAINVFSDLPPVYPNTQFSWFYTPTHTYTHTHNIENTPNMWPGFSLQFPPPSLSSFS